MLAPWKESYDNLSILKSRGITLPTKVCVVKAMVFSVVISRCERWTIKKAECQKLILSNCGAGKDTWGSLELQGEIIPVNPEGVQPWLFIGRLLLKLKLQYFGHLMQRADSLENTLMLGKIKGESRMGRQRKRWLDSITNSMDMNLGKVCETVENRGAWHTAVHEVTRVGHDLVTEQQQQYKLGICIRFHLKNWSINWKEFENNYLYNSLRSISVVTFYPFSCFFLFPRHTSQFLCVGSIY